MNECMEELGRFFDDYVEGIGGDIGEQCRHGGWTFLTFMFCKHVNKIFVGIEV